MRAYLIATALVLACAGCTVPGAQPGAPNGDVTKRPDAAAPDTPPGVKPAANFKDKAVDTDPASPRTRDTQQRIQVPSAQ